MAAGTATTQVPSPLSFSPATFAKLIPSAYLLAHLQPASLSSTQPVRPSGRSLLEKRSLAINTSPLSHSSGSATARLGATSVVCAVRAELLYARDIPHIQSAVGSNEPTVTSDEDYVVDPVYEPSRLGLLVPNVELSTGCSPAHLPGSAPSTIAQSLTHRIHELLGACRLVDAESLRIYAQVAPTEGSALEDELQTGGEPKAVVAYWALYIDILFISIDGGALQAAWAAVLAALGSTLLPMAEWDIDNERVVCSARRDQAERLRLSCWPVICAYSVFTSGSRIRGEKGKTWILGDADGQEEDICREQLVVVSDESGRLRQVVKSGGVDGEEPTVELLRDAVGSGADWRKVITDAIHD